MTTPRKFYRTRFTIDILSEDTPFFGDVEELAYAINEGDCVGSDVLPESTELTGKEVADALYAFGSQPAFFGLDDDGEEVE